MEAAAAAVRQAAADWDAADIPADDDGCYGDDEGNYSGLQQQHEAAAAHHLRRRDSGHQQEEE
jgi:hypothetical protein